MAFAATDSTDEKYTTNINNIDNQKTILKESPSNLKTNEPLNNGDNIKNYSQLKNKLLEKKNQTINLDKTTFKVDQTVTVNNKVDLEINGNGAIIDGQSNNGFLIFAGNSLKINNITFRNFKTSTNAAIVISSQSKLNIVNCTFINSQGQTNGANINSRGSLVVKNCVFENNQATKGSAIRIVGNNQNSTIENSIFKNNYVVTEKESVIELTGAQEVTINNCSFINNQGRIVHAYQDTNTKIINSTITNVNTKYNNTLQGAIIDNYEANMYIYNNKFENITITAPRIGGGLIYNEIGKFVMDNNTFNKIKFTISGTNRLAGGILWNRNSTATIKNNLFDIDATCNDMHGGAFYNNIGILNVTNNTFNVNVNVKNELAGGAIYNDYDSGVNIKSKLYYGDNSFDGITIKNAPIILNKTIRNKGDIYLIGVENLIKNKNAIITVTAPSKIYTGQKATFNIDVYDKDTKEALNGIAIIKINGLTLQDSSSKTIIVNITKGKGNLIYTLKSYSGKKYNVSAIFSKSHYNRAENTTTMTVLKGKCVLDPITVNTTSEGEITINKIIKDTYGNVISGNTQVAIKLGDRTVLTTRITDGVLNVKVKVPYLPPGENKFRITLGENYRYESKIINNTLNIHKQNVTATIAPIKAKAGEKITIKTTLKNSETNTNVIGGKFSYKLDAKSIPSNTTLTVKNAVAQMEYTLPSDISKGVHYITIVYAGNTQSNTLRYDSKALTIV